ncbi:MAG: flavin reductase family protein [Hyphomonadaceae bacterium]|nr:flavin reductase family protein [Hyphomonadaceae bacterium]
MVVDDIAKRTRDGLRRLAKAVVIITARDQSQCYAMAATAVSEVSMDPPSLLICINRKASIHAALEQGADFCLNILHSSQETISAACSGQLKGEVRFERGAWTATESGLPYLEDAQANFMCRNDRAIAYGTHTIFIGVVEDVRTSGAADPLIYVDGRYTVAGAAAD